MIRFFILTVILTSIGTLQAQEFDCKFSVDTKQLSNESRSNLDDFQDQLTRYMNNYRWTSEDFKGSKIPCSFQIIILSSSGQNNYTAQVFVGSQRPIYKLGRNTAVTRILDVNWDFSYTKYEAMNHDDSRFDALMSFLDFYAYVILGYDFDSYKSNDGTQFFQKAGELILKARNSPGAGKGWDPPTTGGYSRSGLIDDLTNAKFYDMREGAFRYHYYGLDLLHNEKNVAKAKKNVLSALEKISNVRTKLNRTSVAISMFFDAKYLEICQMFQDEPDRTVYTQLSKYDPEHLKNYDEYSKKTQ